MTTAMQMLLYLISLLVVPMFISVLVRIFVGKHRRSFQIVVHLIFIAFLILVVLYISILFFIFWLPFFLIIGLMGYFLGTTLAYYFRNGKGL